MQDDGETIGWMEKMDDSRTYGFMYDFLCGII